jgi:hypothetical protein
MPPVTNAITAENSHDFLRLREQKKLEGLLVANDLLAEEAGSAGDGWKKVTKAMYQTTQDKKSRVAAVQAARLLGDMTGYLPSGNGRQDSGPPPGKARIEFDASFVADVKARLAEMRENEG